MKVTPAHVGYQNLLSLRKAPVIFEGTVGFRERHVHRRSHTREQLVQATAKPPSHCSRPRVC